MDNLEIRDNELYFDGCNTVDLAEKYGTPLYVMSETEIVRRCREIREMFLDRYDNTKATYASKAFLTVAMCKIIEREGLSLDVVSGGELYTAMRANFPADRIDMHGNNKSYEELEMAINYGVGNIIVNTIDELDLIEDLANRYNKMVNVMFRVSPEVSANTHEYISTGKRNSKFGLTLDEHSLYPAINRALESRLIDFRGFHFHVGSQLHDNSSHLAALETVLNLIKTTTDRFGRTIRELNIGGGFGVNYTESDNRQPYDYFLNPVMERVFSFCLENKLNIPVIAIEPGRSIVAEAGMTLYSVGSIKDVPGVNKYVSVNGGMPDNIRPSLYGAEYEGVIANKASEPKDDLVTISGKCCESGDILIKDAYFAQAERGDILAIFATGAYGYSMANNYNKILTPAVVMINDGQSELMVRRQTYEDLLHNEVLPQTDGFDEEVDLNIQVS